MKLTYHVTHQCNKQCVSCGHFVPLVPKEEGHKSLEKITEDLHLISYYSSDIQEFGLGGGEPLLHPNIRDVIILTRQLLPNTVIRLDTNCILKEELKNLKDVIVENDIHICATPYNIEVINELSLFFGREHFGWYEMSYLMNEEGKKSCFFKGFFSTQRTTTKEEALNCEARRHCVAYEDGKIYPCQYAAYFKYFDNSFKGQHNLELGEEYYVDLSTKPSIEDIQQRISNMVMPMCYQCIDCRRNCDRYLQVTPIGRSQKAIEEWLIVE